MMRSFIRASNRWISPNPYWLSVGAEDWPNTLEMSPNDGFRAVYAKLPAELKSGYTAFKESIWRAMHDVKPFTFTISDYRAFREFGQIVSSKLLELRKEVDVYYVNDYQQVQVGPLIGPAMPTVFHWHGPARFAAFPASVKKFCLNSMDGFDAVCVSTYRDLDLLRREKQVERAYQVYPFIDPMEYWEPSQKAIEIFKSKWKLEDEPTFLCVARMDEQKRQDILLLAFSEVVQKYPKAKLMLVGNGSFSSIGLGQNRGAWKEKLIVLAKQLEIEDKVRFTGYLSEQEMQVAYEVATALVLPSPVEGFGLVGVEAWIHRKPIIVTNGAGISELVQDGRNGYIAKAGKFGSLTEKMLKILDSPNDAVAMGVTGSETAKTCYSDRAAEKLRLIFDEVLSGDTSLAKYEGSH